MIYWYTQRKAHFLAFTREALLHISFASNRDDPTPKVVSMARKEKLLSAQSQIRNSFISPQRVGKMITHRW